MLYLLKRTDGTWDENAGFVIRADSAREARTMASKVKGDENVYGFSPWLDYKQSRCSVLKVDGPNKIILTDFHEA